MSSIKEKAKTLKRVKVEVGEDFIIEVQHNGIKFCELIAFMSNAKIHFNRTEPPKVELSIRELK